VIRISPEAPVPVVKLQKSTSSPGGAANVAANVAGLGAKVELIGCVGNDPEGEQLITALRSVNVGCDSMVRSNDRPSNVKTRVIAHNQQVVRVDQEVTRALSTDDEAKLVKSFNAAIDDADLVVCSDYAKGVLSRNLLRHMIDRSREHGKSVIVDPKGRDFSRYSGADLLTPNKREAAEACGLEFDGPEGVVAAGETLMRDLNLGALLITESEHGMTLFEEGTDAVKLPAHAVQIYDVTGAGDTVIATVAVGLASGYTFAEAAEMANVAASVVVGQVGTTAITAEQLAAALVS
jgi:D-beta-D-heptose 7-phosphate kinase/D-beta-D-heptose 1-phosphate adenosyltransferase